MCLAAERNQTIKELKVEETRQPELVRGAYSDLGEQHSAFRVQGIQRCICIQSIQRCKAKYVSSPGVDVPLGHGVHVAPLPALSSQQSSLWFCVASQECIEGKDVAAASTKTLIALMGPTGTCTMQTAHPTVPCAPPELPAVTNGSHLVEPR